MHEAVQYKVTNMWPYCELFQLHSHHRIKLTIGFYLENSLL
jgi:hypothetical protein